MNPQQKKLIIDLVSLAIAIAGGLLAIGNEIKDLNLPGWLTQLWPTLLVGATIVNRIGNILLAHFASQRIKEAQADEIRAWLVAGLLCFSISMTACSLTPEQKKQWSATGGLVARKVAAVAGKVVLDSAIASLTGKEANWLDSAAAGVRTLPASITSEDIAEVVKIWTPAEKSEKWDKLGNAIADVAKQELERGTPPPKVAEGVAVGLNNAAATARK